MTEQTKETIVSNPVEAVVSSDFKITKKEALKRMQETFDKSINKGDLVGASIAATQIKAIASAKSC